MTIAETASEPEAGGERAWMVAAGVVDYTVGDGSQRRQTERGAGRCWMVDDERWIASSAKAPDAGWDETN